MSRISLYLAAFTAAVSVAAHGAESWNADEIGELRQFSLAELGAPPVDASNRFADDPRAAEFGRTLFFDPRLSSTGRVSCATCHAPELRFQDGRSLSQGIGVTLRSAMPIGGYAHQPFFFWD